MSIRIVTEGGASGHMMHIYENREITFNEIKEIIQNASAGKLEKTSEKTDGMNIVFTYDVSSDSLKVARSHGDIKRGGMNAVDLAKKFQGRGNIEEAFNSAFEVLQMSLTTLSGKTKVAIFGLYSNKWYSAEVIYAKNPNVVNYDANSIVFHGTPIFLVNEDGTIEQTDDDSGVSLLSSNIGRMQKAVAMKDWKVRGPALTSIKKLSDGSAADAAISQINAAMANAGVGDENTIEDYLRNLVSEEVVHLGVSDDASLAITERVLGTPGAPSLTEIKKIVPKEKYETVNNFVKSSNQLLKRCIEPIEMAIHQFSIEVLRGIKSILMNDSDAQVVKLRDQVSHAINAIKSGGNEQALDVLDTQMKKLGSVENITTAIEGIVFFYKGQAYKITGSFAPVNQILGLFKYGRGQAKIAQEAAQLRDSFDLLIEKMTNVALAKDIASSSSGMLRPGGSKRGATRLMSSNPGTVVTDDQITTVIKKAGYKIIRISPPGSPGSKSGRFSTYRIAPKNNTNDRYDIIIGIGANKGQNFENELNTEVESYLKTGVGSPRILELLKSMNINSKNVKSVTQASKMMVRRPLTRHVQNVGPIISDMTLTMKTGEEVYVSLKNREGDTFANSGYKGAFYIDYQTNSIKAGSHELDEFIEALGVDKDYAAKGYTSYLRRDRKEYPERVAPTQDFTVVQDYLASAYGYGYWYVKEVRSGFKAIALTTPSAVTQLIGDVVNISLRYPGLTKQITAVVETTNGNYKVEIRNSKGAIEPTEIKIKNVTSQI